MCGNGGLESHLWPTVFADGGVVSPFGLVAVSVDKNLFWVMGACHAVVTEEDDVDGLRDIAGLRASKSCGDSQQKNRRKIITPSMLVEIRRR